MARPTKQGVDYFPLDVHLDNKFKFVEIKFGLEGFASVIKIMQDIYSQGYWMYWGEDEKLLFSDEHKIDYETLEKITDECTKRDIFSKRLYEKYNILTSKGLQNRYKEIVKRRKEVKLVKEFLLINDDFGVNVHINEVNADINEDNDDSEETPCEHYDDKSTQSKVKESKVNKTKEDYTSKIKDLLPDFSSITNFNELNKKYWDVIRETRKNGKVAKSVIYNAMDKWKKYDPIVIEYALKSHIDMHAGKKEEYTLGIMRNTKKEEAVDRMNRISAFKGNVVQMPKYEVTKDESRNGTDSKSSGNVQLFR